MQKITNYFRLSKAELRKVIFPLKEQVRNAYITVFAVAAVVSLFLALVDWLMGLVVASFVS